MKVRISFTLDVDRDAWIEAYGAGEKMSAADVRSDVQSEVEMSTTLRFNDLGLLNDD